MLNEHDPFFHSASPMENAPEKPREMTAAEHRAEAMNLLEKARNSAMRDNPDLLRAQIHATLALSAPSDPSFDTI